MARKGNNDNRDYDEEYKKYHGTAKQKKARAMRNAARATAVKKGTAKKGDGKEIDHKKPVRKCGTNSKGNTRSIAAAKNEGWRKGKTGYDTKKKPCKKKVTKKKATRKRTK